MFISVEMGGEGSRSIPPATPTVIYSMILRSQHLIYFHV